MSKTVLFYFSGTGNSLAAARSIAEGLTDTIVVPMLKGNAESIIDVDTERIGLIYPIHMNAVPRAVVKFTERLKCLPEHYVFAVATHGGIPGMAGLHLNKVLKEQKIALDAYFEVEMINNTPKGVAPKPLMELDWELSITPDIIEAKLKTADDIMDGVIHSVMNKERKTIQIPTSISKKFSYWMMKLLWSINEKSKPKLDFIVDEDCIGCGICQTLCTTNRIKVNEGKPEWTTEDCNYCYACFNYCPVQAIGVKHYTKKLGRYHHPKISSDDIASQL
jgi:formate hydrogenlyase subunit 6/NADH:ubiquinone oxidoreductase subunit I/flavodoxin